jgi:hypothetical protein
MNRNESPFTPPDLVTAELASIGRGTHNWDVRIRVPALCAAMVFLLASSIAANAFADLRSSATAMACCVKTHGHCAGLNAPDNCCKRMGHTGPGSVAGTVSAAPPLVLPAIGSNALLPATLSTEPGLPVAASGFKRPHDPPHLHPFNLLI